MPHIQVLFARARSATAAGIASKEPRPFWKAAEQDVRRLEREGTPWSQSLAGLVRAGLAKARGDHAGACDTLSKTIPRLDDLQGRLHAAAARRCLGQSLNSEAGRRLVQEADAWMAAEHIRNPARMTAALIPGFLTLDSAS